MLRFHSRDSKLFSLLFSYSLTSAPLVWGTCISGSTPIHFALFPRMLYLECQYHATAIWVKERKESPTCLTFILPLPAVSKTPYHGALGILGTDFKTSGLKERVWLSTPYIGSSIPLHLHLLTCALSSVLQPHWNIFILHKGLIFSCLWGYKQVIYLSYNTISQYSFFLINSYLCRCQFRGLFWEILSIPHQE